MELGENEKLTYPLILKYRLPSRGGCRGGLLHWKGRILAEFEGRKSLVHSLGGVPIAFFLGSWSWCAELWDYATDGEET